MEAQQEADPAGAGLTLQKSRGSRRVSLGGMYFWYMLYSSWKGALDGKPPCIRSSTDTMPAGGHSGLKHQRSKHQRTGGWTGSDVTSLTDQNTEAGTESELLQTGG